MSLFFGEKKKVEAVLVSPMEGQLLFEGEPASEAKITLWTKWKNPEGEFFTYTADKNGYFKIPEQRDFYKVSALAQIVITQEITVEYKNRKYLIWTLSKTSTHQFGELGGEPSQLKCELTNEIEPYLTDDVSLGTTCQWKLTPHQ